MNLNSVFLLLGLFAFFVMSYHLYITVGLEYYSEFFLYIYVLCVISIFIFGFSEMHLFISSTFYNLIVILFFLFDNYKNFDRFW